MSKLYVVGIGPGGYEQMTVKAVKVLEECDIIVGYTVQIPNRKLGNRDRNRMYNLQLKYVRDRKSVV